MDFEQIKNLIPKNGEKYIIVENGKPVLVLMSFEDYKNNFSPVQKEIEFKEKAPRISEKSEGELTLEDLPF
ncbi:hypothetical protein KJA17_01295 [Patescibacteria group bacterium]|nr:hypothetical protein [Patescibacteria group bacterium]